MSLSIDSPYNMHYKVETNATRKEFREVFAVSINKTRTVLGTDAHSSVLYTIGQRKVVVDLSVLLSGPYLAYLPRGTGGGGLVTVIAIST